VRTEWLTDDADLLAWLEQAGAIAPEVATRFREQPDARPTLDEVAERARDLRRWLRGFVERHAGREVGKNAVSALGPLNALLARDDGYW
jgi:hypothetical protein